MQDNERNLKKIILRLGSMKLQIFSFRDYERNILNAKCFSESV